MDDFRGLTSLIAVLAVFGIPIIAVVGHYVLSAWKAWLEVGLKRDMVARGYTAQEIIEVLAADKNAASNASLPNVPPAKPVKQPAYTS